MDNNNDFLNPIVVEDVNFTINKDNISFPMYDKLKNDALELAENLNSIVVTEDTLKTNKKLVAATRKSTDKLNTELRQVKKVLLQPYDILKTQVDEIIEIVKDAENIVRKQVSDFEQIEREHKKEQVIELFNKHLEMYDKVKTYKSDVQDFLTNQHLNKNVSMNKIEQSIVDYMVKTEQDLEVLMKQEHPAEHIMEYKKTGSLALTLENIRARHAEKEIVEAEVFKETSSKKDIFNITLYSRKDYELVKNYMKEMEIDYK